MTRLAYRDALTGIANRRAFDDEMRRASDRAARYGLSSVVAVFDIDRFKSINDVLGHKTGDAVIVAVARHLCSQTRVSDFVARLGGDEFAIIFASIDRVDAQQRAETLRKTLSQLHFSTAGVGITLSVSVGVSPILGSLDCDPLHIADQAMYSQKRAAKSSLGYF